jgi:hypothetical protein
MMTQWLWVIIIVQVDQIEVGLTSDVLNILSGSLKRWLYTVSAYDAVTEEQDSC